jgi:hypothetical protein
VAPQIPGIPVNLQQRHALAGKRSGESTVVHQSPAEFWVYVLRVRSRDIEPVFYMGVPVAYIRKFSDKLQIEMLRAYKPERYKTPGTNVNIGTRGDVFVLTKEERHTLMDYNRQWLLDPPAARRRVQRAEIDDFA